jgi:hypothetical protein
MFEAFLSHYNTRPHINMHIIETIADFGWTMLSYLPYCYDLASSDVHCWCLKRQMTQISLYWMMQHCRIMCTSGCRARRATFSLQEFMLLFTGRGRLLLNVWNMLKVTIPLALL